MVFFERNKRFIEGLNLINFSLIKPQYSLHHYLKFKNERITYIFFFKKTPLFILIVFLSYIGLLVCVYYKFSLKWF